MGTFFLRSFPFNEAHKLFFWGAKWGFWVGAKKFILKTFMCFFRPLKEHKDQLFWSGDRPGFGLLGLVIFFSLTYRPHPTPPRLARRRPKRTDLDRNGPKRTDMDRIGHFDAQLGCIVKARLREAHFSCELGGILMLSGALVLYGAIKLIKITDFPNTPCKCTCLYNAPSSHSVNSFPENYISVTFHFLSGMNLLKSNLHVFGCDSENFMDESLWNYCLGKSHCSSTTNNVCAAVFS